MKKFNINYNLLCDLMKIYEFLLIAYPREFFDTKSINFSRLSNFLKNLSSRILENFYFDKLLKILEKMNQRKLFLNNLLNITLSYKNQKIFLLNYYQLFILFWVFS